MLPIFTTGQVKDGIDSGDLMIDLSEYMKKKEGATKNELNELTSVVASKLDKEPQHKHHIEDIKELQEALQGKLDTSEKYSFNTIISDIDKIPYIESPKIKMLNIGNAESENPYTFYTDEASGDLMIVCDGILIGNYNKATNSWSFGGVLLNSVLENHYEALNAVSNATLININDIAILNTKINDYITKTDAILQNHYQALIQLCEQHGMIDSYEPDSPNITPIKDV